MAVGTDIMTHSDVILKPDPARTVLRPFDLQDPQGYEQNLPRFQRIAERVMAMDDATFETEFSRVHSSLDKRHRDIDTAMARRFCLVTRQTLDPARIDRRSALIGAYFLEEFSFESAALFNPSMIAHWDQSGLPDGGVRFIISLRGIGEGHLSSVTFRRGTWSAEAGFQLEPLGGMARVPEIEHVDDGSNTVRVSGAGDYDCMESVLFPVTPAQARGIEDMRMVRFVEDDGSLRWLGTYTAFSGTVARSELMESFDFKEFELHEMTGAAAQSKGMALFPRKVGGRYMALSRQDSENIWLTSSDSLTHWDDGAIIVRPAHFWEFVQIGNCGSPIEIDEGWLVLTHGVGSVRNYCIGAVLLDRDDPSKVLGRRTLPLVHPSPAEREGYVPNVVYSCGAMVHDRTLLLPYGVADNFTTFAHVALDELLATLA